MDLLIRDGRRGPGETPERESFGEAIQLVSPIFDVRQQTIAQQGITIDVGGVTRGWLLISGTIVDDPLSGPAHTRLYCDTILVGHIGSSMFLIERFALDGTQNLALYRFAADQTLQAISVWARQMVDGQVNNNVLPLALSLQATANFWKGGA